MGLMDMDKNQGKVSVTVRHFCMLGLAAGLGILLAQDGTTIPVHSREPQKIPASQTRPARPTQEMSKKTSDGLASMDIPVTQATAGTHVPLPEADLEAVRRIDLDQIETVSKNQLPVASP